MHTSHGLRRSLVTAVVVGCGLLSLGAVSASAYTWSPTGPVTEKGSLTLRLNGGSPVVCSNVELNGSAGGQGFWVSPYSWARQWPCAGGTSFGITLMLQAVSGGPPGGPYPLAVTNHVGMSPFGGYEGTTFVLPFTNGSGGNPSKVTFANTLIGRVGGGSQLTATGTLNVTTPTGGLVTIN